MSEKVDQEALLAKAIADAEKSVAEATLVFAKGKKRAISLFKDSKGYLRGAKSGTMSLASAIQWAGIAEGLAQRAIAEKEKTTA